MQRAQEITRRIQKDQRKQVVVTTLQRLPDGAKADEQARQLFAKDDIDGLLVLVVKQPRKLVITAGKRTSERFTQSDAEQMRRLMLARFGEGRYDDGLLDGLRFAERRLIGTAPARGGLDAPARGGLDAPARGGLDAPREPVGRAERYVGPDTAVGNEQPAGFPWGWVLGIGAVVLLGGLAFSAMRRGTGTQQPGSRFPSYVGPQSGLPGGGPVMGPPLGSGMSPSTGGGWGKALIGGVAGAAAGNWLYDRFVRDHHQDGGEARPPAAYDQDLGSSGSDQGQVGYTAGGDTAGPDWGGSSGDTGGSADVGGGDSGGGDSGGGNDW